MIRTVLRVYRDSFSGLPRPVWLLSAALVVNRAGTMVLPFMSLYLVRERGMSTAQAATILAAFGVGSLVGSYSGGRLSVRFGPIRVQEASLILSGIGFLAVERLRGFEALVVGFFLMSVVSEAFRPASATAVVELAPDDKRIRAVALLRLAANIGMAIGPAAGGLLAAVGYRWLFVGDALTCWAAAVLLFRFLHRYNAPQGEAAKKARADGMPPPWRDVPFVALMGITLLLAMVFFQVFATLPVYLNREYGLAEKDIGLLLGFNALLIVIFEMVLVRWLEKRDTASVVGLGSVLVCLGFAILPLGSAIWLALVSVSTWTVGEMLALPFSTGLVAQRSTGRGSGEYMGLYTSTYSIAFIAAPLLGFFVYETYGGEALWFGAGALAVPLWFGARWVGRRFRQEGGLRPASPPANP